MDPSNLFICKQFSQGDFTAVYPHFSDGIEWEIVGNQTLKGKESVIDFCTKMTLEMDNSVLSNENIIDTENQIAIQGRCSYLNAHKQESFYSIAIFILLRTAK